MKRLYFSRELTVFVFILCVCFCSSIRNAASHFLITFSYILMIQLVRMELFTEDHSMEMRAVIVLYAVKYWECLWASMWVAWNAYIRCIRSCYWSKNVRIFMQCYDYCYLIACRLMKLNEMAKRKMMLRNANRLGWAFIRGNKVRIQKRTLSWSMRAKLIQKNTRGKKRKMRIFFPPEHGTWFFAVSEQSVAVSGKETGQFGNLTTLCDKLRQCFLHSHDQTNIISKERAAINIWEWKKADSIKSLESFWM